MSIQKIVGYEFLNPNMWDFYFIDNSDIRFLVKSTTLPFIKFETETRTTGEKFIKGYESETEFSITFNETQDFSVYEYMKKWEEAIYNKKEREFNNVGSYVKDAILSFTKHDIGGVVVSALFAPIAPLASLETVTKSFKFSNMMFIGFENMDWDYESTTNKEIICNFTVDSVDEISATPPPPSSPNVKAILGF